MNQTSQLISSAVDPAPQRQPDDQLKEVECLKKMIASLQDELLCVNNTASAESAEQQKQLFQLREANQHLVAATFGAQDSTTAAEASNKRQTIFLSILAHELRNPTAAIAIANSVIESMNLENPRLGKLLSITRRQASHLVRLVDDLLDASRISTGKISLQMHRISLREAIDCALETIQPLLTKCRQTVQIELTHAPMLLLGDMVRLSQLFANLLSNASKFSDPNTTIWITASIQDGHAVITVKDEGQGIAPEHQLKIFDLFSQGDDERENSLSGGLGIGLSLVKTIAELHHGSVTVESVGVGCGSEFIVTLPLLEPVVTNLPLAGEDEVHKAR
jgi:signal transduction histidine kinase